MKALVLSGGGAKGAYQVGAWRALRALDQQFDVVTGTSIGAINGAMYVQGDFERAYDFWYNLKAEQVLNCDTEMLQKIVNADIKPNDIKSVIHFFTKTVEQQGLDISPMRQNLSEYIDEDRVRQSPIKFGIVTVSLSELKPVEISIDEIPYGQLHDYLLASANLPVFKMQRKHDKLYIDGGFFDNTPISLARRLGATDFTVIDLKAIGFNRPVRNVNRRVISSVDDLGKLLEFTSGNIRKNLEQGYCDTLRSYRGYLGRKYYIEAPTDANYALAKFLNISDAAHRYLSQLMGVKDSDKKRFAMETLVPDLAKMLDLDKRASYADIYIGLLEQLAQDVGLERFELRTLATFEEELSAHYQSGNILPADISVFDRLISTLKYLTDTDTIKFYNTVYEQIGR